MERIKKEEEMRKKKEQEDSLTLEQTKEQVNWIFMVYIFMCLRNVVHFHYEYRISTFFAWVAQNMR